jgi:hypothetical protein
VPQLRAAALITLFCALIHLCCLFISDRTAGEILPQAVCRSYGLQVGSYSALLVRLLMGLSAPISWPISKLLDWILGEERSVRPAAALPAALWHVLHLFVLQRWCGALLWLGLPLGAQVATQLANQQTAVD